MTSPSRPQRLRLSRKRGFNLLAASRALNGLLAVKVDRTTALGNPFRVGVDGTAAECAQLYRRLLAGEIIATAAAPVETQRRAYVAALESLDELSGMNIACWCRLDAPCHGDVLLEEAARLTTEAGR